MKEEDIWSAFKHFESNKESGYITSESVIEALKFSDFKLNEKSLKTYFDHFSLEGKRLDFTQFKIMVGN